MFKIRIISLSSEPLLSSLQRDAQHRATKQWQYSLGETSKKIDTCQDSLSSANVCRRKILGYGLSFIMYAWPMLAHTSCEAIDKRFAGNRLSQHAPAFFESFQQDCHCLSVLLCAVQLSAMMTAGLKLDHSSIRMRTRVRQHRSPVGNGHSTPNRKYWACLRVVRVHIR